MLTASIWAKSPLAGRGSIALMVSLKAKLNAWVGKYRMQFTRLPRQKEAMPCSAATRVKQLPMPV
jgi:hypothetical protein